VRGAQGRVKMEREVIEAVRRSVIGKQVKALRREGKLPAILYGSTIEPTPVLMDLKSASNTLNRLSGSALVTINLEGKNLVSLVREKQRDALTGTITHVDFQIVSMKEKIRTDVPVEIHGEAPAVKNFNGILVQNVDELEVEALPGDLPERIVVDVSGLTNIGQSVLLRDIALPEKVTVLEDLDLVLVVVTAPEAEEVVEVVEVVGEEPEVIEKGKKEEEEGEV
jgi:large subunit ribosomal protein L25